MDVGDDEALLLCEYSKFQVMFSDLVSCDDSSLFLSQFHGVAIVWMERHTSLRLPLVSCWDQPVTVLSPVESEPGWNLFKYPGTYFMNSRKSRGPRTQLWGTPDVTGDVLDVEPCTCTVLCWVFEVSWYPLYCSWWHLSGNVTRGPL